MSLTMTRRNALCALAGEAWAAPGPGSPPLNFVVILMDDLGWADLGCYGSRFYQTPHLDRLAREGVRFTNAYAAAPVCSPTRASLMTGKYPARLGITNYLPGGHPLPHSRLLGAEQPRQLPLEEVTLAEALKARGYATGHIGKWHLGPKGFWPEDQGFDVNIGGTHSGMPHSYFYPQWGDNPPVSGKAGDYLTDRLTDEAEAFLERRRDRPFFLYLPHYAVHVPIEARQALVDKYRGRIRRDDPQNDPVYAAMIESADESVGRIAALIERLNLRSRTMLLFTSDNGGLSAPEWRGVPVTSNAPLREGKGHLYEGGIRVPLIAWGGPVRRGMVAADPVASMDIYPTLLRQAGGPATSADGRDLTPLLESGTPGPERTLYWHYPHYSNQLGKPASAIRRGRWKLIEFQEDGRLELYDLSSDQGEARDLAAALPQRTAELHQALRAWRLSLKVRMPIVNGNYDPAREGQGYWWQNPQAPRP